MAVHIALDNRVHRIATPFCYQFSLEVPIGIRNFGIPKYAIRYSDGQYSLFRTISDRHSCLITFSQKMVNLMSIVFCKNTYEVKTQYTKYLNNIRCHIFDMNHIILMLMFGPFSDTPLLWTIFDINFSDIGRTRTDFCLKLAPLELST